MGTALSQQLRQELQPQSKPCAIIKTSFTRLILLRIKCSCGKNEIYSLPPHDPFDLSLCYAYKSSSETHVMSKSTQSAVLGLSRVG